MVSVKSHSAAFQIQEQSAAFLGTAFSGTAASGQDASTAFYNPAALVNIKHQQISVSNVALMGTTRMHTHRSTGNLGELTVGVDDNPQLAAVIPGVYYAGRLTDKIVFGFATTVPFGLKTEYASNSMARYVATLSELQAIDFTPNIGYQVNSKWAVGGGMDILLAHTTLNMNLDTANDGRPETDSWQHNKGKDWVYSYHAGFLYTPTEQLKWGAVYHGRIPVKFRGFSDSSLSGTQTVQANVTLPESVVTSLVYKLNHKWTAMGDIGYTHWKRVQMLTLGYESGVITEIPVHFKDSWRFAVGAEYQWTRFLAWRFGTSFEQTPVNGTYRTPRVPDTNRIWLTAGARYELSKNFHLDLGVGHIFFKNAAISDNGALSSVTHLPLFPLMKYEGDFSSQVNLIGIQLSWDYL
jgi:long-chain fatty acid transport protein